MASQTVSPPNILWIYGEDMSPDLGCYGVQGVETPNLDRLASEGRRYTRAFVTSPVCSSSRSAIITGCYQTSFGAHHHFSCSDKPLDPSVRPITDHFQKAGWFTSNSSGPPYDQPGKEHFNFRWDDAFEGIDWSERSKGQPFYAQVNLLHSHRMFHTRAGRLTLDPTSFSLPPYYPDTDLLRRDWASYLEGIQRVDRDVGEILDRLEREGLAESTVVVFLSDHGRGQARDKQFCYDGGIRVPLIIRWPGKIEPGEVCDDLVSLVDLAPTTLAMAGLPVSSKMEGRDFLDPGLSPREYVISARDRCDGTLDRIRCVRTKRYKYIRNFFPDRPYMQFNAYKQGHYPAWSLLPQMNEKGLLTPEQARFCGSDRPAEELYDLDVDPFELHNLADDPDRDDTVSGLRTLLDTWISETGDQGAIPEDPEVVEDEVAAMEALYREYMLEKGLLPDASPDTRIDWWKSFYRDRYGI
jgi:uncharacterized sulfatase